MCRVIAYLLILLPRLIDPRAQAATLVYHSPTAVVYHQHHPQAQLQTEQQQQQQHPGYTIVAPLTKIAHVTYDSVPISHTPYEHVPLFQRIGHARGVRF